MWAEVRTPRHPIHICVKSPPPIACTKTKDMPLIQGPNSVAKILGQAFVSDLPYSSSKKK